MSPDALQGFPLIYLGTVYSRYCDGHEAAHRIACEISAKLIGTSLLRIYCPVAHMHPIAWFGDLSPTDDSIWDWQNEIMIERSDALLVAEMDGWRRSRGLARELESFEAASKPVYYLDLEAFEVGTSAFT